MTVLVSRAAVARPVLLVSASNRHCLYSSHCCIGSWNTASVTTMSPLQQPLLHRTCSDRPATTTDNIHLSYNAKRKPLPLKRTALNRLC